MRSWLAVGLTILFCGAASAAVVCVTGETAEVRTSPAASSIVVLEVPTHYSLAVAGERNGYYQVSDYRGRMGWIAKEAVAASRCGVVNQDRINVRGGPGTGHEVVLSAREGVAFEVLRVSGEWAEVRHESGQMGWIFRALLWGVE